MKKIINLSVAMFLALSVLAQSELPSTGSYGAEITKKKAVAATSLSDKMQNADTLNVKVKGTITEVCQNKGCWMTLDMGGGETLRVKFKNYAFFVPKDATGKTAWVEGTAKNDVVSVDQLRHIAEDAGKSEAEIKAITEPKEGVTMVAKGVIIE